jgi:hypothetical protein
MTACLQSLPVDSGMMASRAGDAPALDPRLIDRVVADFEEMVDPR